MNIDPNMREELEELFAYMDDDPGPIIEHPRRKRVGSNAEESRGLGIQSLTDGDAEAAIKHFQRAVEQRQSGDVQGHVDLGGAFEYADMEDEAEQEYLRAQASADSLAGLAALRSKHGRFKDAVVEISKAVEQNPNDPFLRFKLAQLMLESGQRSTAFEQAKKALELDPTQPFFPYWIGDLLIQLGRFDEALTYFRLAIELSPGDDHLLLRCAVAFWGANRRPEAIRSIRLAGELDPSKLVYHGLLEALLLAENNKEDALAEATKANQMDRYDRDLLARLLPEFRLG